MHSHCYVLDAIYYLPRLQVTNLQFFSEFFQTSSVSFQTVHLQPLFRYSSFLTWLLHGRLTFPELAPYVSSFSSCSTEIYKNMAVSLPNLFLLTPFFFSRGKLIGHNAQCDLDPRPDTLPFLPNHLSAAPGIVI